MVRRGVFLSFSRVFSFFLSPVFFLDRIRIQIEYYISRKTRGVEMATPADSLAIENRRPSTHDRSVVRIGMHVTSTLDDRTPPKAYE